MDASAEFSTYQMDATTVLTVAGTIDLTTARLLRDEAERLREADETLELVVDLRKVDFIDSTGLGALVAVQRALDATEPLRVVCTSPIVRRAIDVTALDRVLTVTDSVEAALA